MDPLPIIQQEIDATIMDMKRALQNREDMINDPRGGNIEIFSGLEVQILNDAQKARSILHDIIESIKAVRNKTCNIQISETALQQRENYVRYTQDQIAQIEKQIEFQNSRSNSMQKSPIFSTAATNRNDSFNPIGNENQLVSLSKNEQLNQLERDVSTGVQIGYQIIDELQTHQKLLEDLDQGVTNATEAMQKVTDQIKDIINTEGKTPTLLVALLSVVFIILLFFVI